MYRRLFLMLANNILQTLAPVVVTSPTIMSAVAGSSVSYSNGTATGLPTPVVSLVELLDASNTVLATNSGIQSYPLTLGQVVRIRQTFTNSLGSATTTSSPVSVIEAILSSNFITPTAWPADMGISLTADTQTGSFIYYVDVVNGVLPNDSRSTHYLQRADGQIIDKLGNTSNPITGLPYGTDINNPGAGIVAWKHWAAVGPTRSGKAAGVRTGNAGDANTWPEPGMYQFLTGGRINRPDCWFFKRGQSQDLKTDLDDYKVTATGFTSNIQTLTLAGASYGRQVMSSYGPSNLAPFKWTSRRGWNFFNRTLAGTMENILFGSLWFDGHVSDTFDQWSATELSAQTGRGFGAQNVRGTGNTVGQNIQFQDLILDGCGQFGMPSTGASIDVKLVDSVVAYSHFSQYSTGTGDVLSGIDTHGTERSRLTMRGCKIVDCGYRFDPRRIRSGEVFPTYDPGVNYPHSTIVQKVGVDGKMRVYMTYSSAQIGQPLPADFGFTYESATQKYHWLHIGLDRQPIDTLYRSRNIYSSSPATIERNLLLSGGSGLQTRYGGQWRGNFIYAGYVFLACTRSAFSVPGGEHGNPDGTPSVSDFSDNVIQMKSGWGAMHTGDGVVLNGGHNDLTVSRNIISAAYQPIVGQTGSAIYFQNEVEGPFYTNMNADGDTISYTYPVYTYTWPLRRTLVSDNIIDFTGSSSRLLVECDGKNADIYPLANYVAPGLIGNAFRGNKLVGGVTPANWKQYIAFNTAPVVSDTVVDGTNVQVTNYSTFESAYGAPNTRITMKSHMTSNGISAIAGDADGVFAYAEMVTGRTTGSPLHRGNPMPSLEPLAVVNAFRSGWGMAALT